MNQHSKNQFGYSLIGVLVAAGVTAIVALGAAYVLNTSQNTGNFGTVQSEIDRLHYLNLQLSRNPAFILRQPGFEKTGPLYRCLQHNGANCTQLRAPASYTTIPSPTATPLQKNISSSISFQLTCPSAQSCTSVSLTTVTSFNSPGKSPTMSFQTRRSVSTIPGYILVPSLGFNYNCVLNQGLITLLNYQTSQVQCQPLKGTLSNLTAPLTNFGPLTPTRTQTMANRNCGARGFASIGSFQDQTSCLNPVMASPTTTLPSAPPPTVTPLTAWNCTDGYAAGAPCNTGKNIVDGGSLSVNNPGSATIQLTTDNANGTPDTRCVCSSGTEKVISCSGGFRFITCQGGANPRPSCPWPGAFTPANCHPVAGGWYCPAFDNLPESSYICP
jgi:hypothetical protein